QASFGLALHMHQPTIPAGGGDLQHAGLISNLQHMLDNQGIGDNHNASVFIDCYGRMGNFIPDLVSRGKNPRIMLDYSGNLLWGIRQMGLEDTVEKLRRIACDKRYIPYVEWLGTTWSHAVATSTPVPDLKLHIMAWRKHFSELFGIDAVRRVKGFSPPEMHLPIHPDQCYEYIKALKECGYQWLMVQEHTIENPDGSGIRRPHLPHRLVAKNSKGETQEIVVLVKTQGSDTKLVAQMQPYHEAMTRQREDYAGKNIPLFVLQIGDGENGGVMMNEFPRDYNREFENIGTTGTVALNGSEYLDHLYAKGIKSENFLPVQPVSQHRIWNEMAGRYESGAADKAIDAIKQKDRGFNLDKASWTSDRSWVAGYNDVLDPMNKLSADFHAKYDGKDNAITDTKYQQALLYLLLSQTSCFRYWGQGLWTDYAKELTRRGNAAI
ncbi:MAG TPA: glycosyl hydrolase family 57, partial [Candidatus Bathyarchaeia archaeon]|nr:glycosyl hydrolase family 57 [Candidatus Bathyarchaeia archaeon]